MNKHFAYSISIQPNWVELDVVVTFHFGLGHNQFVAAVSLNLIDIIYRREILFDVNS